MTGLLLALLVHCLFGYTAIPFWKFLGLDFHNLHAFHNCEFANSPYLVAGHKCKDILNRPLYYPPLLYWAYFWTRGLELNTAYYIFVAQLFLAMLVAFILIWKTHISDQRFFSYPFELGKAFVFWSLMLGTLPFLFSLERGNSDSLVVLLWCCALYLFVKNQYFFWGVASAAIAFFKLYPAIPCVVLGLGFVLHSLKTPSKDWKPIALALAGGTITCLCIFLSLYSQQTTYFFEVLPSFSKVQTGIGLYSHSVFGLDALFPGASLLARALLLGSWLVFCALRIKSDPLLSFSGCLAISTFFSGTSYDYNLVTVFPLLLVLFIQSHSCLDLVLLIVGVVAFLGDRHIWHSISPQEMRVIAEVAWLTLVPLILLMRRDPSFRLFSRSLDNSL